MSDKPHRNMADDAQALKQNREKAEHHRAKLAPIKKAKRADKPRP